MAKHSETNLVNSLVVTRPPNRWILYQSCSYLFVAWATHWQGAMANFNQWLPPSLNSKLTWLGPWDSLAGGNACSSSPSISLLMRIVTPSFRVPDDRSECLWPSSRLSSLKGFMSDVCQYSSLWVRSHFYLLAPKLDFHPVPKLDSKVGLSSSPKVGKYFCPGVRLYSSHKIGLSFLPEVGWFLRSQVVVRSRQS